MKKLVLALCLLLLVSMPVMAEEIQWAKFGLNDGSVDTVYLVKSGKLTGGAGFTPITFINGTIGLRIEYVNELTGNMLDTDMLGGAIQVDVVKAVNLIPKAQWQLPDLGVKFSVGYLDNIENFDFKDGEPAIIISIIKLF